MKTTSQLIKITYEYPHFRQYQVRRNLNFQARDFQDDNTVPFQTLMTPSSTAVPLNAARVPVNQSTSISYSIEMDHFFKICIHSLPHAIIEMYISQSGLQTGHDDFQGSGDDSENERDRGIDEIGDSNDSNDVSNIFSDTFPYRHPL